jgi:hypothetical protein
MDTNTPRAIGLHDLAGLTFRANVAFAVRCAQRMRPSMELADASRRHVQMAFVDAAISAAEAYCNDVPGEPGRARAALAHAVVVAEETAESTHFAAYAAVRAAEAAAYAEQALDASVDQDISAVVAAAFGAGRVLAANVDAFTLDLVVAALYADVEKLLTLGHGIRESPGAPIDPSDGGPLGALWPAGVPGCLMEPCDSD